MQHSFSQLLALGVCLVFVAGLMYQHHLDVRVDRWRKEPSLIHRTCVFTDPITGKQGNPCQAQREAERLWDAIFNEFSQTNPKHRPTRRHA